MPWSSSDLAGVIYRFATVALMLVRIQTDPKAILEDDQSPAETDHQPHSGADQEAFAHDDLPYGRALPVLQRWVLATRSPANSRGMCDGKPKRDADRNLAAEEK